MDYEIQSLNVKIMQFNFLSKISILNNFINFYMYKNHNVSTSSDWIFIIYDSLESPCQGASNRTIFMSLASVDGMISTFYCLEIFANNFLSIDFKDINQYD